MYRLLVESLLGLRVEDDELQMAPCLPIDWTTFKLRYRYRDTAYHIHVTQIVDAGGPQQVNVDGVGAREPFVRLVDDRQEHRVEVTIHRPRPPDATGREASCKSE
jgi:cellobiose phosphorylase